MSAGETGEGELGHERSRHEGPEQPPGTQLIVTDSTALISLERIGRLDVLPAVFPNVAAPPAVIEEFGNRPAWLQAPGLASGVPTALRAFRDRLDLGETEALALALSRPGSAVVMDERRGRQVAARMDIETIGTLGLLLLAKDRGLVPAVRPLVEALAGAGFHLSEALYEEVLRLAGEELGEGPGS